MNKVLIILLSIFLLISCSKDSSKEPAEVQASDTAAIEKPQSIDVPDTNNQTVDENLPEVLEKPEWNKYYTDFESGCIAIADLKNYKVYMSDKELCSKQRSTASTFKILNTLIGLELNILKDKNTKLDYKNNTSEKDWDPPKTLEEAFKKSIVPYYQELARRIGHEKMNEYVMKMNYGNRNITGGIDKFWLVGGLAISPLGQLDFLSRVYMKDTTFSNHSYDVLNDIMTYEKTDTYTIKAKTGLTQSRWGWWTGWVETEDNVYFFANLIKMNKIDKKLLQDRIEITKKILKEMEVIN